MKHAGTVRLFYGKDPKSNSRRQDVRACASCTSSNLAKPPMPRRPRICVAEYRLVVLSVPIECLTMSAQEVIFNELELNASVAG